MKQLVDWRVFLVLLAGILLGSIFSLPYIQATFTDILLEEDINFVSIVLTVFFMNGVMAFIGLSLGKQVNLGLPYINAAFARTIQKDQLRKMIITSLFMGLCIGLTLFFVDRFLFYPAIPELQDLSAPGSLAGFLGSFYGAIIEEVMTRLFFVSCIVWLISKFIIKDFSRIPNWVYWTGIIISAMVFAVLHFPALQETIGFTPLLVIRTFLLNSIPGAIFGWLYWKKGLESAMMAHFGADVMLHALLVPLFYS